MLKKSDVLVGTRKEDYGKIPLEMSASSRGNAVL